MENTESVPAVLETAAAGEIAEVYCDIRKTLGTSVVNLIWRNLATIQGASIPIPYGGKVRQVMVDIDSHELLSKGLSPTDVVNAVNAQNVILPSGTAKIGRTEYNVGLNGSPSVVDALNHIPVKVVGGGTIYIQDVAHVRALST